MLRNSQTFLINIFPQLATKWPLKCQIPQPHFMNIYRIPLIRFPSHLIMPQSPKELELEIMAIPLNKSYGLYSCPARILKCSRYILSNFIRLKIHKNITRL
jgi:hypothetical protein